MIVPMRVGRDRCSSEGYESSFVTSDGEDGADSEASYVPSESD